MVIEAFSESSGCLTSVLLTAEGTSDDVDAVGAVAVCVLFDGESAFVLSACNRVRDDEVVPADLAVAAAEAGVAAWNIGGGARGARGAGFGFDKKISKVGSALEGRERRGRENFFHFVGTLEDICML